MECDVFDMVNSGIAVELLVPGRASECSLVGIRLRTYGKELPPNRMVLASGETFSDAFYSAVAKAEQGRWEPLDWSARPWGAVNTSTSSTRTRFNLV